MEENIETGTKKGTPKAIIAIVGILVVVYLLGLIFFGSHYFFRTKIGGADYSLKSKTSVKKDIMSTDMDVDFILNGREDASVTFNSHDVNMSYALDESLLSTDSDYVAALAWPKYIFVDNILPFPIVVNYDKMDVRNNLVKNAMFDNATSIRPVDAYIGEYDSQKNEFHIVPDVQGNTLSMNATLNTLDEALSQIELGDHEIVIDLDASGDYLKANLTGDSEVMSQALATANRFVASDLLYTWNDKPVEIHGETIADWVICNGSEVSLDEDAINTFVKELAYENDTYGKPMMFMCNDGTEREIKRGGYGWKTDCAEETKAMIEAISAGNKEVRDPVYVSTGYVHGQNDVGPSYVEVNMTTQHLWVYIDGEVVFDTDVVTGNMSNGNATPQGIFGITYKTKDAVLKGETYESHVKYWMPFNGNVGMHDATWRGAFGGVIFLTSGSHGCVNLPLSAAATIYDYVCDNFPVVCYY